MIYGEEFTVAEIDDMVYGEYSPQHLISCGWQIWIDDAGI